MEGESGKEVQCEGKLGVKSLAGVDWEKPSNLTLIIVLSIYISGDTGILLIAW